MTDTREACVIIRDSETIVELDLFGGDDQCSNNNEADQWLRGQLSALSEGFSCRVSVAAHMHDIKLLYQIFSQTASGANADSTMEFMEGWLKCNVKKNSIDTFIATFTIYGLSKPRQSMRVSVFLRGGDFPLICGNLDRALSLFA
jgi:hypothetical protein